MPFKSHLVDPRLISDLNAFAYANSFPDLYRAYSWRNDTYANGFSDIYCLESRLIQSDRTSGVTLDDVRAVAAWGAMRNQGRIKGPVLIAPRNTFHTPAGLGVPSLEAQPLTPLGTIVVFGFLGVAMRLRVTTTGLTSTHETTDMGGTSQERRPVGPVDMRCGLTFSATLRQSSPQIARIHRVS